MDKQDGNHNYYLFSVHYVERGKMDNIGIIVGLGLEISQNSSTNAP